MNLLQNRLMHCLETILDLQPFLHSSYKPVLCQDFSLLANYLEKMKNMELCEEDLCRIERLASAFLKEVKFSQVYKLQLNKLQ